MRLGLALPTEEAADGVAVEGRRVLRPETLAEGARRIEATGFDSAWVFDSIGRGFLLPDPMIALSVAATVTRKIELGTGVLQIPLRNTVDFAHRILTAHLICGGRLRLGVGAGSTAADFAALGMDFDSRFRRLDESLATMRKLWAGERVGEAQLGTWPVTAGGPPIFIGSWAGSRWIERAAREFDGWVGSGARSSWKKVHDGIARFRSLGGKRAILTNVVVRLDGPTASTENPDDPFDLACPPSVARERLARIRDLGYDDVVLVSRQHDLKHLEQIRALV
jgi:alkanesulfonate monooxygenase SsuD/methylene tetrahydromethanopterin reductase-like flavin-dependent oxidoreductase (luciferase family)